jgi:hypothetical protein
MTEKIKKKSYCLMLFILGLMLGMLPPDLSAHHEDEWRVVADVYYLPLIWIQADEDGNEPNNGLTFDARVGRGEGHGLRIGVQKKGVSGSLGVIFLEGQHRDGRTNTKVRSRMVALEGEFWTEVEHDHFDVRYYFAMGLGGGGVYFKNNYKDSTGGLAEVRLGMGMEFSDTVSLNIGAGVFVFGSLGETKGGGEFLSANFKVNF